jgi:hypothetical protein
MPNNTREMPRIARAARFARIAYRRFLWLIVLSVVLSVSAYSLYFVARHFGVPPIFAAAMSTCFDGAALIMADLSLRYVQSGRSGTSARVAVWAFAGLSAYLQTFHVRLGGHEPPGGLVMWASLPIIAVTLYELHARFDRRKALASSGSIYPSPMPQWGINTWMYFPLSTLNAKRELILARRGALSAAANVVVDEFIRESTKVRNTRERPERASEPARSEPASEPAASARKPATGEAEVIGQETVAKHRRQRAERSPWLERHSPDFGKREWARQQPEFRGRVGERGKLPADIVDAWKAAHPEEEASG